MRLPLLGLSALALVPRVASATEVWNVGVAGDFTTIQAALDSVAPGDRLLVAPGVYDECLTIDQSVDLLATGGPDDTSIRCSDGTRPYAVAVSAASVARIDGFTIDHTQGLGGLRSTGNSEVVLNDIVMSDLTSTTGAGCVDGDSGILRLHGLSLTRCLGTNGGAVRLIGTGSVLSLSGSVIDDSDATGSGGGVYFEGGSMTAGATTIRNSVAGHRGGGLYINATSGSTSYLTDLVVEDCQANSTLGFGGGGGGIYSNTPVVGIDVEARRNVAAPAAFSGGEGGGLLANSTVTLVRGAFTNNTAAFFGGGIHSTSTATLYGTRVANNEVGSSTVFGQGGGISVSVLTTHGTTIEANTARGYGGGMAGATWISRDDVVVSNQAIPLTTGTAGTHVGGAAYLGTLDTKWSRFSDNVASGGTAGGQGWGGAIYSYGSVVSDATRWTRNGSTATLTTSVGGAIYAAGSGTQRFTDSFFESNKAVTAGAIQLSPNITATIQRSEFQSNEATGGHGGALYQNRGTPTSGVIVDIEGSFFRDNKATNGSGGALYVFNTGFDAQQSWFTHNTASDPLPVTTGAGLGGAVHVAGGTSAFTYQTLFCRNSSGSHGGAIYGDNVPSFTEFNYTVFQENSATGTGARGGAYWENGRTTYPGNTTYTYYSTYVGNTSGAVNYGGFAGGTTARLYAYQSVYEDNGTTAVRNDNPNFGTLYVYYSDFSGHPTAAFSSASGSVTTVDNIVNPLTDNPPLPGWTPGANCFDDDLTAAWRTNGASTSDVLYTDQDGDGDGLMQRDCQINNGSVWIGATEVAGNGTDDDCFLGENADQDGDGYGPDYNGGADCSEGDPSRNPDVFDGTDEDYDNEDCVLGAQNDADGDGQPYPNDCADDDPVVNTMVAEVPFDGAQQNCAYSDFDADLDGGDRTGFGDGTDCDDTTDAIGPFAIDTPYDGVDQDCDGVSDFDADLDGFDSNAFGGTDCNDSDPYTSPAAAEIPYDGVDQDCAGKNDYDADEDGFVPTAYNAFAGGTATGTDDCDDANPNTYPGAPEVTDGLDNTCDDVFAPDPDFDGDGVLDNWEVAFSTNPAAVDTDGDGISDGDEWGGNEQAPANTDGDATIDALDLDADGDSIPDAIEGMADSDGDGLFDFHDGDDDGDGIDSVIETDGLGPDAAPDTDKDGIADWLDLDSDGDGSLDLTEGTADPDADGIGAWRDDGSVGDGSDVIPDGPEKYGFGCGCTSAPASPALSGWLLGLGLLFARRRRA